MGIDEVFNEVASKAEASRGSDQSSEPKAEQSSGSSTADKEGASQAPEVLDLDKVERFKFDGREMTPKEAKLAWMRLQDYTSKTQELAKDRETLKEYQSEKQFVDNLYTDLQNVKNNPGLADQFRQIYPDKFHTYLDILQAQQSQPSQNGPAHLAANPELLSMKKELSEVKNYFQEQRVQAAEAQIDAIVSKLSPKYPLADEETVLVRARAANDQGVKVTPEVWEEIYKGVNEKNAARYKQHYEKQVKEQQAANSNGKDIGKGGGTPGAAPKKRSFDEATRDAIAELSARH